MTHPYIYTLPYVPIFTVLSNLATISPLIEDRFQVQTPFFLVFFPRTLVFGDENHEI